MSILKKLFVIALALTLVIGICACGEEEKTEDKKGNETVNTTESTEAGKNENSDDTVISDEKANTNEPTSQVESEVDSTVSAIESEVVSDVEEEDDGLIDYTIYVVDADGNPVANKNVQFCDDSSCRPAATNSEGVVVFSAKEGNYKACILGTTEYTEFNGKTEITLVVAAE